jgi:transglutaminase-like putative cysteine protease
MDKTYLQYLNPTEILDSDNESIMAFAQKITAGKTDSIERAIALYYAVRDGIWYDPYVPFHEPKHYLSSFVLKRGTGFCIHKAGLLATLARACQIPARLGFANVRNHLTDSQLSKHLGTDIFSFHGYTEFFLEDRWVKATPAFNKELCEKSGVIPLEFDGINDSIFQATDIKKQKFMEYVDDLGIWADIPVEAIVIEWKRIYGDERVQNWIEIFKKGEGEALRNPHSK